MYRILDSLTRASWEDRVTPRIRAIETLFRGYRFRSRLEARYAVFFDMLGLQWDYELEGFDIRGTWYLPDFYFPDLDTWGEVKPGDFTLQEYLLARQLPGGCLIFSGIPDVRTYPLAHCHRNDRKYDKLCGPYGCYGALLVNLPRSVWKGRLWMDYGEGFDICGDVSRGALIQAALAARGARFEHGEHGAQERTRR